MKNIFINNYRKNEGKHHHGLDENLYYINSGSVVISNKAESNIMMKELTKWLYFDDSIKIPS